LDPRTEGLHSSALLEQVRSDLATTAPGVQLARAFPHQRAVTTFCLGLLFAGVLTGLGWAFPQERSIFFARLMGQNVSWPQQTTLALLPPFVDGQDAESFVETKTQHWELSVLEGSNVHLRVRADGLVPDAVHAELNGVQRSMRSLTGGTFAIRLPSLQENQTVTFHGGDDQDDLPVLQIQVGRSPELKAWSVAVTPPAYTGIPAFQSDQHELNVPEGSTLTLTFEPLGRPAEIGITENEGYTPLTPNAQGAVSYSTVVEGHGEVAIHIVGQDGFANPRAAQFLWKSIRDRPPRLEHLWPPRSWNALVGGSLPISFSLSDDYGLRRAQLGPLEKNPWNTWEWDGRKSSTLQTVRIPLDASQTDLGRFQFELQAFDDAPQGTAAKKTSAWIRITDVGEFEETQRTSMIRVREQVERILQEVDAAGTPQFRPQRLPRKLDQLTQDLEVIFCERVYSHQDLGAEAAMEALETVMGLAHRKSGDLAEACRTVPLTGRAGALLQLAEGAHAMRQGPAQEILNSLAAGEDPAPAVEELRAQLQEMLHALMEWEDFQSAIELLRGLLERQRALQLRTQEAVGG